MGSEHQLTSLSTGWGCYLGEEGAIRTETFRTEGAQTEPEATKQDTEGEIPEPQFIIWVFIFYFFSPMVFFFIAGQLLFTFCLCEIQTPFEVTKADTPPWTSKAEKLSALGKSEFLSYPIPIIETIIKNNSGGRQEKSSVNWGPGFSIHCGTELGSSSRATSIQQKKKSIV